MMPKNQHCLLVSGLDVVCLYHYGSIHHSANICPSLSSLLPTISHHLSCSPLHFNFIFSSPLPTTFHLPHLPSPLHSIFSTLHFPHHLPSPPHLTSSPMFYLLHRCHSRHCYSLCHSHSWSTSRCICSVLLVLPH